MISYILTSSLLVIPAWIGYLFLLRNKVSLRQRKSYLYVVVLGSLLFPVLVPYSGGMEWATPPSNVKAIAFGSRIDHQALQNYCRCENPNYSHRIKYRADGWYNFLFKHKVWFTYLILTAMGVVMLTFLVQLLYLKRLVESSQQRIIEIDGQACVLLFTKRKLNVAAFWLGKPYIIWQDQLIELTPAERLAIFRHELSHIRQWNTLEKAALRMLQCVWLINPVFYLIRKELDLLSEFIADESGASALAKKQSYAHLLVRLQQLKTVPLTMSFHQSQLRKRIEHLIHPPSLSQLPLMPVAAAAIFICQIGVVSPLFAEVETRIHTLETYEVIYHKVAPNTTEAVYCTDCETLCTPGQ